MERKKHRSNISVIFSTFRTFIKNAKGKYFFMILLTLFPAVTGSVKLLIEKQLFDGAEAIYSTNMPINSSIITSFTLIIAVQLIYLLIYPIYRSNISYVGSELENILQDQLNKKTSRISLESYENPDLYKNIDLASSASRDIRFMTMMFSSEILLYVLQFIMISAVLFSFHKVLVAVGFLAIIPDVFVKYSQSKMQYKKMENLQTIERERQHYKDILTTIDYLKETRITGTIEHFKQKWLIANKLWSHERISLLSHTFKTTTYSNIFGIVTTLLSYALVIYLTYIGQITIGAFAASLGSITLVKSNLLRVLSLGLFSIQCAYKGKYYYEVLEYEDRAGEKKCASVEGGIHLENVSFSYNENKNVLQNIHMHFNKNTTVAIVGRNGSGKTTLSKLLMGLFVPTHGKVFYGNDDLSMIDDEYKFQFTSAVIQDFAKYYLTLSENVHISRNDHTIDSNYVIELLSKFGLINEHEVSACEEHLNSQLGTAFGGKELSHGNWQKLAIARGLYRPHNFIVIDEPTSAIDPLMEDKIISEMLYHDNESIKVIITHKLNMAMTSDMILVMDCGKVVEQGTHAELINLNGIYANMWNSQAMWYQ